MTNSKTLPAKRAPLTGHLAWLVALAALYLAHHHRIYPDNFWDAHVYANAIGQFRTGTDPYQQGGEGIPFLYPPLFLLAASAIQTVLGATIGWNLYILLTLAAVLAIPFIMKAFYSSRTWLTYPIALALFLAGPRLAGASSAIDGNVNSLCAAAILVAGVPGVNRNKWKAFYVTVAAASSIKLSFLGFLLIPLLTAVAQAIPAATAIATTAAVYLIQRILQPALFQSFQANLFHHTIQDKNDGYSIFGLTRHLAIQLHQPDSILLPAILHIAYCSLAIYALYLIRSRFNPPINDPTWLSLILITTITINPRMMDYDAAIAAIPALAILISGLLSSRLRTCTVAALALCLLGTIGPTGTSMLLLLLSALVIGYLELAQSSELAQPKPIKKLRTVE